MPDRYRITSRPSFIGYALKTYFFLGRSFFLRHSLPEIQSRPTHFWNRLNAFKKGTYTNSVDPDETPHQSLRCFSLYTLGKLLLMIDYKNRTGSHSLRSEEEHTFCQNWIYKDIHTSKVLYRDRIFSYFMLDHMCSQFRFCVGTM